jgi:hypothetical protein
MSLQQLLGVQALCLEYNREMIYIMGRSWSTAYLNIYKPFQQKAPEKGRAVNSELFSETM